MRKFTTILALFSACCFTAMADETNWTILQEFLNSARADIKPTGIGYPAAKTQIRQTLQAAINEYEDLTKDEVTSEVVSDLLAKLNAYRNSTDIELPVDGKTYTFTFVTSTGNRSYMNYAPDGYTAVASAEQDNANYPATAKFVCRDLGGGQFAFFNSEGKYLCYTGYDGANDGKGYTDAYDETYSPLTIEKLAWEEHMDGTAQSLLGYVTISGKNKYGSWWHFILGSIGFCATKYDVEFQEDATSAIRIEEAASLGTTVKLNPATGIDGVDNIATFSAPFATVAPEGTQVWYVTVADDGNALMQPVEAGLAIPAGAGVILTSSETEINMLPATDETLADLEGNKLVGSGGEALQITDISGAYILTGRDGQVGFYYLLDDGNTTLAAYKAYLRVDASTQAIRMDFSGNTTGISAVEAPEQADAPVYDLSGRRVLKAEKGVYVKNGKKFIVK